MTLSPKENPKENSKETPKIVSGDKVLLYSQDNKGFLITVSPIGAFSSHIGKVTHKDIIGKEFGELVYTHLGHPMAVLRPTTTDLMMKLKRGTQIIYPKDAAYIVLMTGVRSGMRVLECGTGSGALTIALATAVAPEGKVFTYDRREEFSKIARENVEGAGLAQFVEFKIGEAKDGFEERGLDAAVIDLPSPWDGIPAAAESLGGGGVIASLSPTFNQVEKTAECLRENGFVHIDTVELLMRRILARPGKTRPADRMVGHTGFLMFARKVIVKEDEVFSEK